MRSAGCWASRVGCAHLVVWLPIAGPVCAARAGPPTARTSLRLRQPAALAAGETLQRLFAVLAEFGFDRERLRLRCARLAEQGAGSGEKLSPGRPLGRRQAIGSHFLRGTCGGIHGFPFRLPGFAFRMG